MANMHVYVYTPYTELEKAYTTERKLFGKQQKQK